MACVSLVVFMPLLSACGWITPGGDDAEPTPPPPASGSLGPCLQWYGQSVFAAAMNATGTRLMWLTDVRPPTLGEDAPWGEGDRALIVADRQPDGNFAERHIAITWEAQERIAEYATAEPGPTPEGPAGIAVLEQVEDLQMDREGSQFVVAVSRRGIRGNYAKLYTGAVRPPNAEAMTPNDGLTLLEINRYTETEGIQSFALSPDGSKVAAIVGVQGELRVWDLKAESNSLNVYEVDKDGKPVVSHDLPEASIDLSTSRRPLIASDGSIRVTWSPNSDKLAIARGNDGVAVGQTLLEILEDLRTGKLTQVRAFPKSATPHVAWSSDGGSLFVMNTPLFDPSRPATDSLFQNTQVRRLQAKENGAEMGSGIQIERKLGYRTDPGNLVPYGDDEHFFFIWEGQLLRLDAAGGDLSKTRTLPIAGDPSQGVTVLPRSLPAASKDYDSVMFVLDDNGLPRVGLRTEAKADRCSVLNVTPEGGGDGAAPAGEGAAPTGDAPAGDAGAPTGDAPAGTPEATP